MHVEYFGEISAGCLELIAFILRAAALSAYVLTTHNDSFLIVLDTRLEKAAVSLISGLNVLCCSSLTDCAQYLSVVKQAEAIAEAID